MRLAMFFPLFLLAVCLLGVAGCSEDEPAPTGVPANANRDSKSAVPDEFKRLDPGKLVSVLLSAKDPRRERAYAALLSRGRAAVPALLLALRSESTDLDALTWTVWTLGQLGDQASGAVPDLLDKAGDGRLREEILRALDTIPHARAEDTGEIAAILDVPDPVVRRRAAAYLGKLGPAAAPAAPALASLLGETDISVVVRAAWALGEIGPAASAQAAALCKRLPDPRVRESVALALTRLGGGAVEALVRALGANHALARATAVWILGQIGSDAATAAPALVDRLVKPGEVDNVRDEICRTLGSLGPAAVEVAGRIAAFLGDGDLNIWARQALENIGWPVAPVLADVAMNGAYPARIQALDILKGMGADGAAAAPSLALVLSSPDRQLRRLSAATLASMGRAAAPAVPALIKALDDEYLAVRVWAAHALHNAGDAALPALPALEEALSRSDVDENVAYWVSKALERLKAAPSTPAPSPAGQLPEGDAPSPTENADAGSSSSEK